MPVETPTESSSMTDDDHETWRALSSGEKNLKLSGVGERFVKDHSAKVQSDYWQHLIDSTKSLGFTIDFQQQSTSSHAPLGNASASPLAPALPAAFNTSSGKKHIESLCKLFNTDAATAVQFTLGALKGISTDDHLRALLGSRTLFLKVLMHYCQQRSARLGIMVDLLRGNTDDTVLDDLDRQVLIFGEPRGILQKLLACACSPESPPTREQALPLKHIGDEFFRQKVLQTLADQRLFEREQALEALVALFYARSSANCMDIPLIVLALHSCGEFFTTFPNRRLPQLAALLCVEALNLNTAGPNHTLIISPGSTLTLLTNVVMNFHEQVDRRRAIKASTDVVAAPESILMLSLGILLKISEHQDALQCLQLANDCGAFDYLQFCYDALLPTQTPFYLGAYQDSPGYDWQFSIATPMEAIEDETQFPDMPDNLVVYTSIGLELLNAAVLALGEYIRSPENLTVLCTLGATLFANQPILCAESWRQPGNIEKLIQIAFEETISCWKILASLCYDRSSVNRVVDMVTPQHMLELLSTPGDNALVVLGAVAKMAQYDPNSIRSVLLDDPGVIFRILSRHPSNDDTVLKPVLNLLACVLRDCPPWAVTAVKFFGVASNNDFLSSCFASSKSSLMGALVLQSLIEVMSLVSFSYSDHQVLEYLAVTVKGSLAACHSLTTIFAFSRQPTISYSNAYLILKSTSELVAILRQLSLHTSIKVRESAFAARSTMLELFSTSTSFGLALSYFAGAPVSLSIGLLLEEIVQDARLLQYANDENVVDDTTDSLGKWRGVLRTGAVPPMNKIIQERLGNVDGLPLDMSAVHSRAWSDGESAPLFASSAALSLFKEWSVEVEEFLLTQIVPEDFLATTSPYKLLMSAATMPPVVRSDARLAHLWPICGLKTCDLLVHLVVNKEASGLDLPLYDSLAVLSIVTAHVKGCDGELVPQLFDASGLLYVAMHEAVSRVVNYVCGTSDGGDVDLQKGMRFVKLLSIIMAVDTARGAALLQRNNASLCTALVDSVRAISTGTDNDESDRFVAECLSVLRMANMTKLILPDIVELASFSGDLGIVRTELVAQSLEILAQSVLSGVDFPRVEVILIDPLFHERRIQAFRDAIISTCKGMAKFCRMTSSRRTSISLIDPGIVLQAFPSDDSRVVEDLTRLNPYDIKSAVAMIYSQNKENGDAALVASATVDLALAIISVDKHVRAFVAWSMLVQNWTWSIRGATFASRHEMAQGLVDTMHDLAEMSIEVEKEVPILAGKIDTVLNTASELLLSLVRDGDAHFTSVTLQKLVSTMETVSMRAWSLPLRCASLTNLLASTAIVVKNSSNRIDSTRVIPIIRLGLSIRQNPSTFRASLSLLTAIIDSNETCRENEARVAFVYALSQTGLVRSLVDEVILVSTRKAAETNNFDDDEITTVMSLFTVLLALANTGGKESSMISLFIESNLTKMFLRNDMLALAIPRWIATGTDSNYRGYLKTETNVKSDDEIARVSIFLSGRDDPLHKVWRMGMRLLTSLLRVNAVRDQDRAFQHLALNFVGQYDAVLRSCLAQCSADGMNSVLTRNLVDEGDEILTLLSELGMKSDGFLDVTLHLVGSFTTFLGSIGTSRFLFDLVRDVEAANQDHDSPFDNLHDLHHSLSGGLGNARFESIRYAHYARSAYAMVTDSDNLQFSNARGITSSMSELESTCYKAINNDFCAELEVQVAYCLANALTFLSKIHPSSRIFTRFGNEERRHLKAYDIVKAGSIIAAHSLTELKFARVVQIDTVRRCWKCKIIDRETMEANEEATISFDDLAGVEDVMKRRNLFAFVAAPDSGTHLETVAFTNSANLGHLILSLLWCRQGGIGIELPLRTHLAESSAAILATEVVLHHEIGTDKVVKESVSNSVNAQLFDIFDGESKFPGLVDCLSPDFLQRIRNQLNVPLTLARKDRAEKRRQYEERLAAMAASNPWR